MKNHKKILYQFLDLCTTFINPYGICLLLLARPTYSQRQLFMEEAIDTISVDNHHTLGKNMNRYIVIHILAEDLTGNFNYILDTCSGDSIIQLLKKLQALLMKVYLIH